MGITTEGLTLYRIDIINNSAIQSIDCKHNALLVSAIQNEKSWEKF